MKEELLLVIHKKRVTITDEGVQIFLCVLLKRQTLQAMQKKKVPIVNNMNKSFDKS